MDNNTTLTDRIINFFVENQDPRTKTWFLSGSITPLITILATYLYFCLYAGPTFMKNRKPFVLKNIIIAYNAIQVALSIAIVYEGLVSGWWNDYNFRCQPVDYSDNPKALRMARGVWFYYMCKLSELLDTIFFVLRKKQRQVSRLHLYHHTMMPVCGFIGIKYFPGGHGTLLGVINGFIHIIMYAYYMMAAMGQQMQKYLWWKKHLTTMQIVQFVIIFFHTLQIQFQPDCQYPKFIGALLTINAVIFTYMFSSFYYHNYIVGGQASAVDKKNDNLSPLAATNGHAKMNGSAKVLESAESIKSSWYEQQPSQEGNMVAQRLVNRVVNGNGKSK